MDALVDLLPLLFIGAYYLLAGRRRAQQKRAARAPEPEARRAPAGPTPFQSFLEQLEEAMAEASGEPRAEPAPVRPAVPPAPTLPPARDFRAPEGSFDGPEAVDHDAHGFGDDNPLSEEAFEQAPAFQAPVRTGTPGYDPHALAPLPDERPASPWETRLRDPQAAQDAFVLQTLFGPRGGRRPAR